MSLAVDLVLARAELQAVLRTLAAECVALANEADEGVSAVTVRDRWDGMRLGAVIDASGAMGRYVMLERALAQCARSDAAEAAVDAQRTNCDRKSMAAGAAVER